MLPVGIYGYTPRPAWATASIFILCGLVFLFQTQTGPWLAFSYGVIPSELSSRIALSHPSAPLTLVTHLFLHADWAHLAGNMLLLLVLGPNLENRLGSVRFLALFILTGAVGSLMHVTLYPTSFAPLVGASGAISGIMGAYLVIHPDAQLRSASLWLRGVDRHAPYPALALFLLWFTLQAAVMLAAPPDGSGVAWATHLGGFMAGMLLGGIPSLQAREAVSR